MVSFSPTSVAIYSVESNTGNVNITGHLLLNLALEQTKKVTDEINEFGPCKAWNSTLLSTSKKPKKGPKAVSGKRITIDKIYYLSNFVKKLEEYDKNPVQNSTLPSQ